MVDCKRMKEIKVTIIALLAMPDAIEMDFEPIKLIAEIYRPEDFD